MGDILEDIKRDLMYERFWGMFRKYGIPAIALVVIVAAMYGWQVSYTQSTNSDIGNKVYKALFSDLKNYERIDLLKDIAASKHNYKYIAKFKLASLYLSGDNKKKAISIYDEIEADSSADTIFRDLAAYMRLSLDANNHPAKEEGVFRFSEALLVNMNLLNNGDIKTALSNLDKIKMDFEAPEPVKDLAKELMEVYEYTK